MTSRPYDFYSDMLETHRENGYLLVLVLSLFFYNLALFICIWVWPEPDIYLVPGVDRYGVAELTWGVDAPEGPSPSPGGLTTEIAEPAVEEEFDIPVLPSQTLTMPESPRRE